MSDLDDRLQSDAARDGVRFSESRHARLIASARGVDGDRPAAASAQAAMATPTPVVFARVAVAASLVIAVMIGRHWLTPTQRVEIQADRSDVARALSTPIDFAGRAMSSRDELVTTMGQPVIRFDAADVYRLVCSPIDQLRALAVQPQRATTDATKVTS